MSHREADLSLVCWRKSSHSNGDGGDCVEIADGVAGLVPVRDSKQTWDGTDGTAAPVVLFRTRAWQAFVNDCRSV
ncbi:DUF397 domain-containing protein [Streptomyces olivaceus]|uniref:DUF397 domain-containing protein n=1 Tax=Streptomyces sp. VN1 TaxID=1821625 RepID=UPI0014138BB8|nr:MULTISPECIES: DUF397 domain-containing protein [Streptomyces]MBZ6195542.1 DUF397 domain-containing protein [Streptomyces olivaceus]MBZ6307514.1 DUF397 domain-containing protein [Streptomyces olivaceus]MBZ6321409.1 DUF397 domain-containing protein [Streptomyces olivaceus]QIP70972.1 DUF397 domain-containing protein [Streptomyces sp. VN1]